MENKFAENLRNLRGDFSQKHFATHVGIKPNAVSVYERGEKEPTLSQLIKIADGLGISLDQLVTGEIPNRINTVGDIMRAIAAITRVAVTEEHDSWILFKDTMINNFIVELYKMRKFQREGLPEDVFAEWFVKAIAPWDIVELTSRDRKIKELNAENRDQWSGTIWGQDHLVQKNPPEKNK